MKNLWRRLILLGTFCLAGIPFHSLAEAPSTPAIKDSTTATHDAHKLAAKIDRLIAAGWGTKGLKPAALADDAEFVRRAYLDLAGRIPRAMEVRDFLDDPSPDKRARLVDSLLESPNYIHHFTNVWRALLLPQVNNQQVQFLIPQFEAWLRQRIKQNLPFDEVVREILTAQVSVNPQMRRQMYKTPEPTPAAFYQANELKPENLAGATARLFLGVKLECAQCHDHPHDHWTRQQFWEYAAFFSGVQPQSMRGAYAMMAEGSDRPALKIPNSDKLAQARFLDGSEPRWQSGAQPRIALAAWMTASENPYFARALANRLWAHFFGIGLIEPVDELSDQNPPSHPELLDELSRALVANHFDTKFLIRAVTSSQAYQRSSKADHQSQNEPRLFARMAVKGMTPEQLFDSLVQATGYEEEAVLPVRFDGLGVNTVRAAFLAKFTSQDKRTEAHTSILQALALMNGKFVADATSVERSKTLAAVVDSPFLDTERRIETLYLATLSRKPQPAELSRLVDYVTSGGPRGDSKTALADVFWALLNSGEFMLNH